MTITLRTTKGSELTYAELDGNFTDLDTRVQTLETTNANDISLTSLSVSTNPVGAAGLSYDNSTGVFTFTPPDLSSYSTFDGDYNSLTNKPTLYTNADVDTHLNTGTAVGGQILSWDGADYAWVADSDVSGIALADLSVTSLAAAGPGTLTYDNLTGIFQYTPPDLSSFLTSETSHADVLVDGDFTSAGFMTTDGAGNYSVDTNTYTSYSDSDVDTHLNTSTATSGQILSWNGTDYAWVADQTGAGSSYTDADVATYLNGNLDTSIIPDTNSTYDIGSAEYKIRHFYLSNNSMKFVDDTDPLNPVEYPLGVTNDYRLQYNGVGLKNNSTADVPDASVVDITITNHFVTNGTTATLPNGTYPGQKLDFWRVAGTGFVDITVNSAIYMDGANTATGPGPIVWRLGDASRTLYSCIWNGVAWILSAGGPGV